MHIASLQHSPYHQRVRRPRKSQRFLSQYDERDKTKSGNLAFGKALRGLFKLTVYTLLLLTPGFMTNWGDHVVEENPHILNYQHNNKPIKGQIDKLYFIPNPAPSSGREVWIWDIGSVPVAGPYLASAIDFEKSFLKDPMDTLKQWVQEATRLWQSRATKQAEAKQTKQ